MTDVELVTSSPILCGPREGMIVPQGPLDCDMNETPMPVETGTNARGSTFFVAEYWVSKLDDTDPEVKMVPFWRTLTLRYMSQICHHRTLISNVRKTALQPKNVNLNLNGLSPSFPTGRLTSSI